MLVKRYPLTLLVILAILLLSLLPIPDVKPLEDVPLIDKWTHMVMYGGLSLVLWLETYSNSKFKIQKSKVGCSHDVPLSHGRGDRGEAWGLVALFLFPIALGGLLELAQAYLTTYRSGEWLDFVANTIGACLGFLVARLVVRLFPRLISPRADAKHHT